MTEKPKQFDVKAVNPRYKGAMMSDVARALLHPKKDLEERAGRSVTPPEKVEPDNPAVKPAL